jgi:hypothetical protein
VEQLWPQQSTTISGSARRPARRIMNDQRLVPRPEGRSLVEVRDGSKQRGTQAFDVGVEEPIYDCARDSRDDRIGVDGRRDRKWTRGPGLNLAF